MENPSASTSSERIRELVRGVRDRRPRALSRAISLVENERPGFEALLDELHGELGGARRIGVTGPPGSGKSTLTAVLARQYGEEGLTVGILAADPSSPFSGGALLGDRIRMNELATEPWAFIRSMANRGTPGGLATATREAADLMDAFGFDRILLETVGVGQSELQIAESADTTVLVLVPESGDGIQTLKAGIMEVADVFVVNKSDRPGADRIAREIETAKRLRSGGGVPASAGHHGVELPAVRRDRGDEVEGGPEPWSPPVVLTVASSGQGVKELRGAIDDHFRHLTGTGGLERRRRRQLLDHTRSVVTRRASRRAAALWDERISEYAEDLATGRMTPYRVADALADSERFGGSNSID